MDWIKYIRITLGLSQQQMADYLLTSRSMFGMVENAKRSATKQMIDRMMMLHKIIADHELSPETPAHSQSALEPDQARHYA